MATRSALVATADARRITPVTAVEDVQVLIGFRFQNLELLLEALKAAGSGLNLGQASSSIDGNKRIAQVGNAALRLALTIEWYESENPRAVLNKQINKACSADNLATCGRRLQLQHYISTNPSQGSDPPVASLVAITVQALLGAAWIDSGQNLQAVRQIAGQVGLI